MDSSVVESVFDDGDSDNFSPVAAVGELIALRVGNIAHSRIGTKSEAKSQIRNCLEGNSEAGCCPKSGAKETLTNNIEG